jgi:hypothetical protein
MVIGIDISQIVYQRTGVARFVEKLVLELLKQDHENTYILFGSSWRQKSILYSFIRQASQVNKNIRSLILPFPPFLLSFLWNRLHILSIDKIIGKVDIFWSSDWIQPPLNNIVGITTVHDLVYSKFPEETSNKSKFNLFGLKFTPNIIANQNLRMKWVLKECKTIFCDSISTKKDFIQLFPETASRLHVVYPGLQ